MPLYFAYGSNMSPRQMRVRCPGARKVGPLHLPHGKLVFRNCADLDLDHSATIPGGVWRVTKSHERDLDRWEGVHSGYYRKGWIKLKVGGKSEDCFYYTLVNKKKAGICPPTEDYFGTIVRGYEYFGLDKGPLMDALHEAWYDKNIVPWLMDRLQRKGGRRLQRLEDCIA